MMHMAILYTPLSEESHTHMCAAQPACQVNCDKHVCQRSFANTFVLPWQPLVQDMYCIKNIHIPFPILLMLQKLNMSFLNHTHTCVYVYVEHT